MTMLSPDAGGPGPLAQFKAAAIRGSAFIGGGSAVWAIVELLKSEPDKGFALLQAWGPLCFLAAGFLYVLNGIATASIEARKESDRMMAAAIDKMSVEQGRLATAAEAAAGNDNRQMEQMQILVSTVVQQGKRVIRRLHGQDRALERLEDKMGINRPAVIADEEEGEQ